MDDPFLVAEVLGMRAPGTGDRSVWNALRGKYPGLTRSRVRTIWMNAQQAPAVISVARSGSMLVLYADACRALAGATRADEILDAYEALEHVKLYGRQVKDRTLIADATAFQLRADRKLGQVIIQAESGGLIRPGRPRKRDENPTKVEGFTLAEVGIDYKTSSRAQKTASISERAFEAMVEATRERIISGRATKITGETINGARSVMGSRVEPDESLDFFPTPPFSTRALCEHVLPQVGFPPSFLKSASVWEPARGEGHMSEVLKEYFGEVWATDIFDYGQGRDRKWNFLDSITPCDWIITNPPFGGNTIPFILRAIELARVGVAMFLRLQILETIERYEKIFKPYPPTLIAFFAERVNLCKGRWDPDGGTATAYIWLVWMKDRAPMAPFWILPGQREALTRPDDRERFAAWSMPHDPETGEVTEAAE